eukprot:CAMPEP_0185290100 /NCGR_PEP_ID=MMETSP1363-20130426/4316_1 /TAXON_ID=38817 /ORGANISM="Gephyrocapsa oceanica, Strain RCC1303" /LENGTH=143 /DNA_ID=CAMNT_0027886039 /DNA_START=399 /DNA_END=831 /DNA_ORIENTATION=+
MSSSPASPQRTSSSPASPPARVARLPRFRARVARHLGLGAAQAVCLCVAAAQPGGFRHEEPSHHQRLRPLFLEPLEQLRSLRFEFLDAPLQRGVDEGGHLSAHLRPHRLHARLNILHRLVGVRLEPVASLAHLVCAHKRVANE